MILAGGMSAGEIAPIVRECGARFLVVNLAFRLVPEADLLYAADSGFWQWYLDARNFAGYKLSADRHVLGYGADIDVVDIEREDPRSREPRQTLSPCAWGKVGYGGGNSGFQALNIAVQLGARRIALAGLDFIGDHWHGDHHQALRNASQKRLKEWADHFDAAASTLKQWRVDVVNLSQRSILRAFPHVDAERFASDTAASSIQA